MKFLLENTEVISIGRTTVLKNPSDRDYTQLEREQRRLHPNVTAWEPLLRRTYGEKGNTYVWPAFDATHRDIEWELYKRYGERTNQGKNWDLFDHYYLESLNEDVELSNEYDSEGNQLTKAQAEFFKNSKVRDEQGRLLVCYHGSPRQFNTFDKRRISKREDRIKGFYFSTRKRKGMLSDPYAYRYGGTMFKCYLNITNPFIEYRSLEFDINQDNMTSSNDGIIALFGNYAMDKWYDYETDTIKTTELNKGDIIEIIAFEPNQIKSITNKEPSNSSNINEDIELSNEYDNEKNKLTNIAFHSNQIKSISNQSPTGSDNINESLSKIDIENILKNNFINSNTPIPRSWLSSDGTFISTISYEADDDSVDEPNHSTVLEWLKEHGYIDTDDYIELEERGFVRLSNWDSAIILPKDKLTSAQYNAIEEWIDYEMNHENMYKMWVSTYDGDEHVYNLMNDDVDSRYVINRIKRYYASGKLYEAKETIDSTLIESVTKIDNNKSIATLKDGTKFNIWTEMTDAYDNQLDFTKIAYVGDNWIDENDKIINKNILGYVQYSVYNNHAYVQMIEVKESMRRKGVATALMQSLYSDYKKVNWGMTTDDGTKFKKAYSNNINEDLDKPDITQDQWRTVSKLNMVNDIRHYGDLIHLELTDRWGNAIYIGNVTYDALVERVGKTIADIIKHKLDTHEPQVYYYEIYNILNKYRKFFKQDDSKLYLQAKEHFGTTSNPKLAGYLNVDGSLLDFSWGQGYRGTDHREIDQIMDDYSGSEAMYHYMNLGNIRVKPETPGIEIIVEPTKEQYGMIDRLATYFVYRENNFYLDISDKDGYSVGSVEYNKGDIHNIVYDIQNYFKTGKLPVNIED